MHKYTIKCVFGSVIKCAVASFLGLSIASCGDGEGDNRTFAIKQAPIVPTAEQERIDRLQHVVLVDSKGQTFDAGVLTGSENSPDPVTKIVKDFCKSVAGSTDSNDLSCERSSRESEFYACIASYFLAGTSDNPGVVTLTNKTETKALPAGEYRFGVQNIETSVALARAAASSYETAISILWSLLDSPYASTSTRCDLTEVTKEKAANYVGRLSQYIHEGEKAHQTLQRLTLAAADKQLGSTSASDEAKRRSITAIDLSRGAAARLLTSRYFPEEGLDVSDVQAYCDVAELSPQAVVALGVIRQVAPHPADVVEEDVVATSALVDYPLVTAGDGNPPDSGSIRERLIAQGLLNATSTSSIAETYNVSMAAFDEARRYLIQELKTFDREQFPVPVVSHSIETDPHRVRWANTAIQPTDKNFAYYMAIADSHRYKLASEGNAWPRYNLDWLDLSSGVLAGKPGVLTPGILNKGEPTKIYNTNADSLYSKDIASLSAYRASAVVLARALLNKFASNNDAVFKNIFNVPAVTGPLALLAQDSELEGVLSICSQTDSDKIDILIHGGTHFMEAKVLLSAADLECATAGTIEGQPCSHFVGDSLGTISGGSTEKYVQRNAYLGYDENDIIGKVDVAKWLLQRISTRMYIVVPKYPLEQSRRGPGEWRAISGFAGYLPPTDCIRPNGVECQVTTRCRDIPIYPSLGEQVKKVLAPSATSCGQSKVSCAGVEFDARIPLENELSDDNDGVESSWKYYLGLAEKAAMEADTLGKEFLTNSLAVKEFSYSEELRERAQEEKAIAAMDRVQSICGTAVEPETILEKLDSDYEYLHEDGKTKLDAVFVGLGCSNIQPGESCISNLRVNSLRNTISKEPKLAKLSKCLGIATSSADTTNPVMHLGTGELCAWRINGKICAGAGNKNGEIHRDCPVNKEDSCTTVPPEVTTYANANNVTATALIIPRGLGLIDSVGTSGPPSHRQACSAIHRIGNGIKTNGDFRTDLDVIRRWGGLSKERLKAYANALSYSLEPDDHITVNLNGKKWFSTKDSTGWPCGNSSYSENCLATDSQSIHSGLFCGWHDCASPLARSKFVGQWSLNIDHLKGDTWEDGEEIPKGIRRAYVSPGSIVEHFVAGDSLSSWKNCSSIKVGTNSVYRCPFGEGSAFVRESSSAVNPSMVSNTSTLAWQVDAGAGNYFTIASGASGPMVSGVVPYNGVYHFALHVYPIFGRYYEGKGDPEKPKSLFTATWGGFDDSGDSSTAGAIVSSLLNPGYYNLELFQRSKAMYESGRKSESPISPSILVPAPDMSYRGIGSMDLAETVCEAQKRLNPIGGGCDLDEYIGISSLADAEKAGRVLECAGDVIIRRAATATFTDIPKDIEDPLREAAGANVFAVSGGELQEQFGLIRQSLAQVATAAPAIGFAIKSIGADIRDLKLSGKRKDLEKKMEEVKFDATKANEIARCATAVADAASKGLSDGVTFGSGFFSAVGAAATCVNSFAQIGYAREMRDIAKELNDIEFESQVVDFQRKFDDHVYQFQTLTLELQKNLEGVSVALEKVSSLRLEAEKELSNAVWFLSAPAQAKGVSNAIAARSDLARIRYEQSTTAAKRLAFLAKRAIETRLGTPLREMRETMPLVAAPSTWESSICAMNGVDLKDIDSLDFQGLEKVADSSVLSYVKKLSSVVESYRLMNGFHEGEDTAVVSLRDDIHNVRIGCLTQSTNLLKSPGSISLSASSTATGVWTAEGCSTEGKPNCVSVKRLDAITSLNAGQDFGQTPVEHVFAFGTAALPTTTVKPTSGCAPGTETTCGWKVGSRLVQRVQLDPGVYRYSWYGTKKVSNETTTTSVATGGLSTGTSVSVSGPGIIISPSGNLVSVDRAWYEDDTGGVYQRRAIVFTVSEPGVYQVGFSALSGTEGQYQFKAAGPMLEKVTANAPILGDRPRAYEDGGPNAQSFRMVCEDADGSKFRNEKWRRSCEHVCPDGNKADCSKDLVERCFWETDFYIAQRTIERADSMVLSGFARGNYNYRIDQIGLNFVGTGTRDCSQSTTPSTCYGAGYIPYSLVQRGPFYVRNEKGIDYEFDLFPGRIEHARGLSAERYLTNPIGSADEQLLASYLRSELKGRPLDGNFVIRVWDEPGVSFKSIDDVQLVLKYRYWTLGN